MHSSSIPGQVGQHYSQSDSITMQLNISEEKVKFATFSILRNQIFKILNIVNLHNLYSSFNLSIEQNIQIQLSILCLSIIFALDMQLATPILRNGDSKSTQQYTSLASGQSQSIIEKKLCCVRDCIIRVQNKFKILVFIVSIVITYSLYLSSQNFPIYKVETRTQSQAKIINTMRWKALERKLRPEVIRQNKPIVQFMNDAMRYLEKETTEYVDIQRYTDQFGELPFCVILTLTQRTYKKQKQIINSILKQNYSNFELKIIADETNYLRIDDTQIKETVTNIPDNYQSYYQFMKQQCPQYSAIVVVDHNLSLNALSLMNQVYQRYNTWMIYQHQLHQIDPFKKIIYNQSIGVISFFQRVFQLIGLNDFQKDNNNYLNTPLASKQNVGIGYLTLALIELCAQHAFNIQSNKTQITNSESFYFSFDFKENKYYSTNLTRTPFQPLDGLNQDFWVDLPALNRNYFNFLKDDFYNYDRQRQKKRSGFANIGRILKTKQYEQLMYLPLNHSVGIRQINQVGSSYPIPTSQQSEKTRFCVTVLSRNNIQNNRYLRVIQSILQQNYSNYHIVFIDDMSTDLNMQKTMEYTKQRKFESVTYVQNKQRKFGTYNIINAAFTFCKAGQVQLLVDGDDELVGRQVFRVMNRAYAINDSFWVIYTNYRNSHYVYGDSGPYPSYYYLHLPVINKRIYGHMLSPIRSWKVEAIRSIPLEAHLVYGQWFDTGYDDALQYPLFQVVGQDRIHYIKQIMYLANKQYGDNDDSNEEKVLHRVDVVFKMLQHEPYQRLQSFPSTPDKSVSDALEKDRKEEEFVVIE